MSNHDDIERAFEGQDILQKLLTQSGSLADVEDVCRAFEQAVKEHVPAPVVIQALWEDEPRFNSPAEAAQLFGNLLGLYELIERGESVDLQVKHSPKVKRDKARMPEPFGTEGPDEDFIEAAWRYFDDFPKERQRFEHAFENRLDALVSWLDASGLDDDGFGLARHLISEAFAMIELGGRQVASIDEAVLSQKAQADPLPKALCVWLEESLFEAFTDEVKPTPEPEAQRIREMTTCAIATMWASAA